MRPTAIVVSAIALILMFTGFVWFAAGNHNPPILPGQCGLPPSAWLEVGLSHPGLVLMSAGMILLGLLPLMRVILALTFYILRRDRKDVLAAVAVMIILVISMVLK